ncbi:23S rRNA (adenine(2030)-N(6))-methyltransferase RlmJ [Marinobacter confluentis]|uniref:Ribosomal RNA large subunit methyltransferase J n=1 Tax=Marinobacter confluentis TaxID=1697557 RepID=A0A4Z1C1S5_9GAMM|nr:23S rRNA (adenine(2030)-N(6))-methyltransferase RlmJ [Marinobacter confluentis]TGN40111.1 23S rRNA (adenine(2030)-N(6))-methyltransferase RlmJ [Marinobacter confluentis]
MLSYLHAFHAGNFADVHKHASLVLAIRMMQAKASGIACFDTHAGSALYDLTGERALKTGEADSGIRRVWACRSKLSGDDWRALLSALSSAGNDTGSLTEYPGSPIWFQRYLRQQDSLSAFELHPAEGGALADWAVRQKGGGRAGVRVFQEDGLKGLIGKLPPAQPRLLVLIDPSYEVKADYESVAATLQQAWQKCRHGVFLIWYPILAGRPDERLKAAIATGPVRKVLCSEIVLNQQPDRGMSGSGMLVVNPPWGFDARLSAMLADVAGDQCLGVMPSLDWLVPE